MISIFRQVILNHHQRSTNWEKSTCLCSCFWTPCDPFHLYINSCGPHKCIPWFRLFWPFLPVDFHLCFFRFILTISLYFSLIHFLLSSFSFCFLLFLVRISSSFPPFKDKRYKCDRCWKSYIYKDGLTRHKRYECGIEPQFRCPYCPHRAKHRGNLKKHIYSLHPDFLELLSEVNNWA